MVPLPHFAGDLPCPFQTGTIGNVATPCKGQAMPTEMSKPGGGGHAPPAATTTPQTMAEKLPTLPTPLPRHGQGVVPSAGHL